jgi:hypothetical protein
MPIFPSALGAVRSPFALSVWLSCALAVAACASETGTEVPTRGVVNVAEQPIELAPPERGFQVETSGVQIEPGDDVRMCEVVVLPGESSERYYVNRIQSALAAPGEDLIVRAADPGSETAAIMDRGASVPCTRAGEAFGEELSDLLWSRGHYADERFPATSGKILHGGQKLAVEYHYVNNTRDAMLAKVKLSFHVVDAEQIQHLVQTARFENFTIYTPPNGRSSHLGECRVRQGMMVSELVRRTQRYGTHFKVWRVGGEHDGQLVWDSADRRDSRVTLPSPLQLMAGEGFRFQCDYDNPTDRELRYGVSAADETCTLDATFFAAPSDAGIAGTGDAGADAAVTAVGAAGGEAAKPLADPAALVGEDCLLFSVGSDGVARPRQP